MSDKRNKNSEKREPKYSFHNIGDMIHQQWPRLTHEEVDSYRTDYSKFCEAVRKEYGISQYEIEHHFDLMKRETLYAA